MRRARERGGRANAPTEERAAGLVRGAVGVEMRPRRRRARVITRAVFALVVVASMLARARAAPHCSQASLAEATAREDVDAFVAEDEIAGRGGNAYDSNTKLSKVKRCFSNYVFESASDPTLRWVLMSWPSSSALSNATSYAHATFYAEGSARATLRPDVEGKYSAALVNGGDCYASRVLEIEATWTCKPTTNTAITIVFVAFAMVCVYWFGREMASSDFEDKRNIILDVHAAYSIMGKGEANIDRREEYEREMQELTQEIDSEHLTYVTGIDLRQDMKNIILERKRSAREASARDAGVWTESEEKFQNKLYAQEASERFRSMIGEKIVLNTRKGFAWVRYKIRRPYLQFKLWLGYTLGRVMRRDYWCRMLLRFQMCVEFLSFTAFAWRRTCFSLEMYRDGVADVFFYPPLFGPDMTSTSAPQELMNWFFVLLFGVLICPLLGRISGRIQGHFNSCMWSYAELVELGGDQSLGEYVGEDVETGGLQATNDDEEVPQKTGILGKMKNRMTSLGRAILMKPDPVPDDFHAVRSQEQRRVQVVPSAAWESGSDEMILRAIRQVTKAPINLRLIPRDAAERMELMAEYALARRRNAMFFERLQARLWSVGFVLRVLVLRVGLVPMMLSALGFLMVTTSFVPTPWIHVSKDDSATFGGNLFIPLFVGLGSILVSTRMALDTETIEPNLRPVPRFEFLLICVKVILATITAYTEAEFPALGVPSLDAEARLTTLNTARNVLPILACGVLLLAHVNIQSMRGFGQSWNTTRAGSFAGATLFAIAAFAARSFNTPPWLNETPLTVSENWGRPGVVVGIIVTLIAMVMARILNSSFSSKCIRGELKELKDPENVERIDEVLTPEFIKDQVEGDNRRDRVVALVAFNNLLSEDQGNHLLNSLVKKTKMPRKSSAEEKENDKEDGETDAWSVATDAFDELGIIVHCIKDDPNKEFLQKAGEEFVRMTLQAYIQGVIEIVLWCESDSAELAWGVVQTIVTMAKDCIKGGETKTFEATIASVTMECIQTLEFANLMAKLLFVAHDIDIDTNYDEYVVPWQTFRRVIDDAFEIPPRPMAKKLQQVITHVRDPETLEVQKLDLSDRILYIVVSWLRVPVEETNKPKLNWLSSMGYYAAVGKLQDEADEERTDLANDFLSTLLKATLSTDSQISFFAIKTIATLVRVGHATSGILAIDGLPLLFECMVTHQGTSKETFVFEIMYALTNDRESRSKLLVSLASIIGQVDGPDTQHRVRSIELLHQAFRLEIEAVDDARNEVDEFKKKRAYKASISTNSAKRAHDTLYGALIDSEPEIRELAIHALVDLVKLFVWGANDKWYDFVPPVTEEYKDVAYMKFVDRAQRRMNGGALLSTRVHAHLCRGNQSHAMHKDTDKLMAVLLKIINTDADTRVRTAAENALAKVRTLFEDDKMMVNALVAYDERANHTQRGAAPSREVLRNVRTLLHDSVERQHAKDETAAKLRLNEFWRKMRERSSPSTDANQPTRGGRVEIERQSGGNDGRTAPGGRLPVVKESTGYRKADRGTRKIVRHPPQRPTSAAIEREQMNRRTVRAERLAKREAASERWYGGENFRRSQRATGDTTDGSKILSKSDALNERPTITAPAFGISKVPKEFCRPPRRDE